MIMDEMQKNAPIVIIGAMESEMSLIKARMDKAESYELCGFPVIAGTLNGIPAVAALNQVGMVNSAVLTTLLVERCKPACIISQGTAGSYSEELRTGDIVLGKLIRNTNCAHMRPADCRRLEEITEGVWDEMQFCSSDPELLALAASVSYEHGRIMEGSIASCDFWSFDPESIHAIRERFGSDCEEMETYAAAQACSRLQIPFLSVRAISNNELTGESFLADAGEWCQKFVLDIVGAMAEKRKKQGRDSV